MRDVSRAEKFFFSSQPEDPQIPGLELSVSGLFQAPKTGEKNQTWMCR
jgi:hypothetical protein